MNETTIKTAERTLVDLIGLTRPHTPGLERATRRHRMVRALEPIFTGRLRRPFGSGIGGCAAGGMGVNLCVDQLRTNNAGISVQGDNVLAISRARHCERSEHVPSEGVKTDQQRIEPQ